MSDALTESKQSATLAEATLQRTKIGYVGELRYFGIQLWVRAYRLGDDIKVEIRDGRPE